MQPYSNKTLKQIPSLRFLIPFIAGILLQYHLNIPLLTTIGVTAFGCLLLLAFYLLSIARRFSFSWLKGVFIAIVFIGLGGCLSFTKNIEHHIAWVGNYFAAETPVLITLQENLVVKEKSYKALATAQAVKNNSNWQKVEGDVLLYFKKDSSMPNLGYGSQIVITKNLVSIVNSGNPGGFNYARYCSFQNISYQGFLRDDDYIVLASHKGNWFTQWLINIRAWVLNVLKQNIHHADTRSIAEALLIGYRDELDRDLVRAYSNTGVVHIIAISGLHLGMIYWLILQLFKPFNKFKWSKVAKPITVIFVLWMFSCIAGMAPSILRSAIMFTCIAIGDFFDKRSNIYNGLSVSAFIILLINPFSLWDVGFQLTYSAVLSIVIFSNYINNWFYFKNKALRYLWNMCAVTLSAQILTLPIVLYHFHQFPLMFLYANVITVPLSGLILYCELAMLLFAAFEPIAKLIGAVTEWLINAMNHFILNIDSLPFAVWESIQLSIPQACILLLSITGFSYWLLERKTKALITGMIGVLCFFAIRSLDFIDKYQQQKMIVYNVPSHTAIDLIEGRNYQFIGDDILQHDGFLRNFHIKPSRILNRINEKDSLNSILMQHKLIISKTKVIAIVNEPIADDPLPISVDAVIITKNPQLYMPQLLQAYNTKQIVFDGSNVAWKISKWQQACDSLHIKYHNCSLQGSFEMNL